MFRLAAIALGLASAINVDIEAHAAVEAADVVIVETEDSSAMAQPMFVDVSNMKIIDVTPKPDPSTGGGNDPTQPGNTGSASGMGVSVLALSAVALLTMRQ